MSLTLPELKNNDNKQDDYSNLSIEELKNLDDDIKKNCKIGMVNIGNSQVAYSSDGEGTILIDYKEGIIVSIKDFISRYKETDFNGQQRWKKCSIEEVKTPQVSKKAKILGNESDDSIDQDFINSLEISVEFFANQDAATQFFCQTDSKKTLREVMKKFNDFKDREKREWIMKTCINKLSKAGD